MVPSDYPAFLQVLLSVAAIYKEEISEERQVLYFRTLVNLQLDAIDFAAMEHIRDTREMPRMQGAKRCDFFPRPGDLIEHAKRYVRALAPGVTTTARKEIPEDITPPEEARQRLQSIFKTLDTQFGTHLAD